MHLLLHPPNGWVKSRFRTNESINIHLKLIYYKDDIIGLVRPYCVYINLAKDILSGKLKTLKTPLPSSVIKMLDKLGGVELPWY